MQWFFDKIFSFNFKSFTSEKVIIIWKQYYYLSLYLLYQVIYIPKNKGSYFSWKWIIELYI